MNAQDVNMRLASHFENSKARMETHLHEIVVKAPSSGTEIGTLQNFQ